MEVILAFEWEMSMLTGNAFEAPVHPFIVVLSREPAGW